MNIIRFDNIITSDMKSTSKQKQLADLVLHPERLRILSVLSGRTLTAGQIAGHLPDISQASLYRHLKRLQNGGIIRVEKTRRVRGTLEKLYTLGEEGEPHFSAEDLLSMTSAEREYYFTAFIAGIYRQFLQLETEVQTNPDLLEKSGYNTHPVELDPAQISQFQADFNELIQRYTKPITTEKKETNERFYLTTIFFPEASNTNDHT